MTTTMHLAARHAIISQARRSYLDGKPLLSTMRGQPCCLLCRRRFRSERHLARHLARSELHRRQLAVARAAKRIVEPALPVAVADASSSRMDTDASALEQMELVQQSLSNRSRKQPASSSALVATPALDPSEARVINMQMDWKCGECGRTNFACVIRCYKCDSEIDERAVYVGSMLHRAKHKRFAREFNLPMPGSSDSSRPSFSS